jgi:hypothetical protein
MEHNGGEEMESDEVFDRDKRHKTRQPNVARQAALAGIAPRQTPSGKTTCQP